MPPTLEERVAFLEGKVEEHSRGVGEVRELIVQLDGHVRALDRKVDERVAALDKKLDSHAFVLNQKVEGLRVELGAVDRKVDRFREELTHRMDQIDVRLNGRIDALDQKVSRHFIWLVGIQVTVLLSVIGALLAR